MSIRKLDKISAINISFIKKFAGNSSSSLTIDWKESPYQEIILTGNCTLTFTDGGQGRYQLKIKQDATGNRAITWPASVKWIEDTAPTLSTDNTAEDIISFYFDGTNYYGIGSVGFE